MLQERPLGVTLVAGLLTFIGGLTTVVMIIYVIDSMNIFGFNSLFIVSIPSLLGFVLYGCIPVVFYSTGIGLFSSRPWAHRAMITLIPGITLMFFIHLACVAARRMSGWSTATVFHLFFPYFGTFVNYLFRCALVCLPLMYYGTRPLVVAYFELQNKTRES